MRGRRVLAAALALAGLSACADPAPPESTGAVLTEVSAEELVIGQTLEFMGHGFLHGTEGTTRLHFVGVFESTTGARMDVNTTVATINAGDELDGDERQILSIPRFGPFANPFTADASTGTFYGRVSAVTESNDGLLSEGKSLEVDLNIGPSIIIEALEPLQAQCGAPALRALAGIPYRLRVKAIGIKAVRYVYDISNVNGQSGISHFTHDFNQPPPSDDLGEEAGDGPLIFNPIGSESQHAVSVIRVTAYDAAGQSAEVALPITVHRPLEVSYNGTIEVAERYEPVPVSGCIPGSIGNQVAYSESNSESRMQSVSMTVSTSWLKTEGRTLSQNSKEGISSGESRSQSLGESEWEGDSTSRSQGVTYSEDESNNVGFSSTDGESWGWDMSNGESNEEHSSRMEMIFGEGSISGTIGVSGEGSIPGFAKVSGGVETTAGISAGASNQGTTGQGMRSSTNQGWSTGSSDSDTRSFGSTVAERRSESVNGTYALTGSRQRTENNTETQNNTRTWSLNEGVSSSDVVAQGDGMRVTEAFVNSESKTTTLGFSGVIPRTKVGIFYRQTTRSVRRAEVRSYDLCGLATHVGELQFNEWTWAPDLAISGSCEVTPPPPKLPKAHCFISPCGG